MLYMGLHGLLRVVQDYIGLYGGYRGTEGEIGFSVYGLPERRMSRHVKIWRALRRIRIPLSKVTRICLEPNFKWPVPCQPEGGRLPRVRVRVGFT